MKILVTGGAGYIGSHTSYRLLEHNSEVFVLDNLSSGFRDAVPEGAKFIFGDVRNRELLIRVMKDNKIDSVIHFAAKLTVPESIKMPLNYFDVNVNGSLSLIDASIKTGVKNFIFSSTAAVYGTSALPVSEDFPTTPGAPYGSSKLMVEQILKTVGNTTKTFNWSTLRYFNVAGASIDGNNGQRTKDATHLIKVAAETAARKRQALSIFGSDFSTKDGTCIRDYIHIEDLVSAHIGVLNSMNEDKHRNEIFNCGYGHGSSVLEVAKMMQKVSNSNFEILMTERRTGDAQCVVANVDKIKAIINWKPQYDSLERICSDSYQWELKLKSLS